MIEFMEEDNRTELEFMEEVMGSKKRMRSGGGKKIFLKRLWLATLQSK